MKGTESCLEKKIQIHNCHLSQSLNYGRGSSTPACLGHITNTPCCQSLLGNSSGDNTSGNGTN